jgi:hypothetical protein
VQRVPLRTGGGGLRDGEDGKVVYLNKSTGRTQEENPNLLKLHAAKSRQWLKATRQRGKRREELDERVMQLNRMKETLLAEVATLSQHAFV